MSTRFNLQADSTNRKSVKAGRLASKQMDWVFCSDWTCTVGAAQVDELVPTLACEHFFHHRQKIPL